MARNNRNQKPTNRNGITSTDKLGINVTGIELGDQLISDALNINLNDYLGQTYDIFPASTQNIDSVPGIMKLSFVPTYGEAETVNSAMNRAGSKLYQKLRASNRNSVDYEAADMVPYLIHGDSIFMQIAVIKRILNLIKQYRMYNLYTPRAILESMGVDFDLWNSNYANVVYQLNTAIAGMSAWAFPNTLPLFAEHSSMCVDVYKDCDDNQAQVFYYMPEGYYKLTENETGTGAQFVAYSINTPTLAIRDLNASIQVMEQSKLCMDVSTDMARAYEGSLVTVTPYSTDTNWDFTVADDKTLLSLRNTTFCGSLKFNPNFVQTVDVNASYQTVSYGFDGDLTLSPNTVPANDIYNGVLTFLNTPRRISMHTGYDNLDCKVAALKNVTFLDVDKYGESDHIYVPLNIGTALFTTFTVYTFTKIRSSGKLSMFEDVMSTFIDEMHISAIRAILPFTSFPSVFAVVIGTQAAQEVRQWADWDHVGHVDLRSEQGLNDALILKSFGITE